MASSNKHWPSMFKRSKPSDPHHNDINSSLMSNGFQRTTPYTPVADKTSTEPKARWNPKPEQIKILEGIFNSGMVNPPREEIKEICKQLQEYGQVGDANIFYWFQNRKSRSKLKLRKLQKNKAEQNSPSPAAHPQITPPPSSSSSSSDKSSPQQMISLPHHNNHSDFSNINGDLMPMLNSPTTSVNQAYFQTQMNENGFHQLAPAAAATAESFPLPMLPNMNDEGVFANNANITTTQGFNYPMLPDINDQGAFVNYADADISSTQGFDYLSEFSNMIQPPQNDVPYPMSMNNLMPQDPQLGFGLTSNSTDPMFTDPITVPPFTTQLQGAGEVADGTANNIVVFINEVAIEVAVGPFNVREAFGNEAVLVDSSGQIVLTDEWGFTLHPLQHAASYYLI